MSQKRKKSTKRDMRFHMTPPIDAVLSKVVTIHLEKVQKEFIHFDKLDDGTWRMTVSAKTISDANELRAISIRPLEEEKTYGD